MPHAMKLSWGGKELLSEENREKVKRVDVGPLQPPHYYTHTVSVSTPTIM